ncbi:hypothetical protein J5N97_025939 [Dioscorea zingiberensis]|uniref:Uncharacterized protein n=1 Tax=Dioscorea zingiberensis TaxID=325984 RepID=A0A9D5H699_9LILI|nr:hypothetical protein J5N97_025939 [Dioscorea zingiberensis]
MGSMGKAKKDTTVECVAKVADDVEVEIITMWCSKVAYGGTYQGDTSAFPFFTARNDLVLEANMDDDMDDAYDDLGDELFYSVDVEDDRTSKDKMQRRQPASTKRSCAPVPRAAACQYRGQPSTSTVRRTRAAQRQQATRSTSTRAHAPVRAPACLRALRLAAPALSRPPSPTRLGPTFCLFHFSARSGRPSVDPAPPFPPTSSSTSSNQEE